MGNRLSSPAQAEPPNQLKITDLAEVLDLLSTNGYPGVSFYNLGLYLGLSPVRLDIIKENNKDDVIVCLRECLKAWLKKADDVQKKGGPTVFSLVSALRKLGENGVANGIDMEKHPACKILARTSNQSLVTALPQMVPLLHSEMHINETVCVKKEENMLLIEIVKAVCSDSKMLEVFARILSQYAATMEIGNTIMREYRKVCHCDESGDDKAKQVEIYFPPSLTSKFKSMRVQLGSTFDKVELIIGKCPPSTLDKIKNILIFYSEDLKPQVAQCDNIHDILELVRKDCSLDDIELLKAIINEVHLDEAKAAIQEYNEAIEKFSETELSKCLNKEFSYASPLQCERITIVVDRNTDEWTLNDVRRLSANTFHKLSPQNSRRIKLSVIRDDNSFTITCSFPLILSEQLITAALNNIDVLKENKVKRLTIGYCTVYEVNDTSTATKCGLSKQLMLSLSVQLINSKEEVTTLNEENEKLKEQQLVLFQSEKEASLQETIEIRKHEEINQFEVQLASYYKEKEGEEEGFDEEIEKLQSATDEDERDKIVQELLSQNGKLKGKLSMAEKMIEQLQKELKQKDQIMQEIKKYKDSEIQKLRVRLMTKQFNFERHEYIAFEDDIYDFIKLDHPLLIKIVRTEQFTRLKEIKKLGCIYYNIPKATYSRYEQSIGMYYFAGKFVKTLRKRQPELNITDSDVLCVQIAALCYNLGHGPFSGIFTSFLKEIKASQHYWKGLLPNVMMFQHMIEANNLPFDAYLDEPKQDIEFIKELMTGVKGLQAAPRKDKEFLYEIVVNRMSGLGVNRIDSTMRDSVVLGKRILHWRKILNKIRVEVCPDGKKHICANEEDLDKYNGLFADRHALFKELYFERKNRIVATMINQILIKCGKAEFIKGPDGNRLSLIDAIKTMDTYCRINDSIIGIIRETVADTEVEKLIQFLRSSKLFIPIGYVKNCQLAGGAQQLKEEIAAYEDGLSEDDIIVDVAESGYEGATSESMYYISSDGTVKQWTTEWHVLPADTSAPWRVFYTKHNKELVAKMKRGLRRVIDEEGGFVDTYDNEIDIDLLIPEEDPAAPQ